MSAENTNGAGAKVKRIAAWQKGGTRWPLMGPQTTPTTPKK